MKTYIFLSTIGVGGAEKRFSCLFLYLTRVLHADVHLVLDSRTFDKLSVQPETAELDLNDVRVHIYNLKTGSFRDFSEAVNCFLERQEEPLCAHFPLQVPFILKKNRRGKLLASWVSTGLPRVRTSSLSLFVGVWFGLMSADVIDVLNPHVFTRLRRLPILKNKIKMTDGGTFIDSKIYKPKRKLNEVVFLGRIEAEKQALRLVHCLPELSYKLANAGYTDIKFKIIGDGGQSIKIAEELSKPSYEGIAVQTGYSDNPSEILSSASIFLSLQRTSNYPSRSLAEALASGAYPVVTDAGDTALFLEGCPHFSYVPIDFSPIDLFDAIAEFLVNTEEKKIKISEENSAYASSRFTIDRQARYFLNLYSHS